MMLLFCRFACSVEVAVADERLQSGFLATARL